MSNVEKESYEKLLEILYPNYSEMSDKRKMYLQEIKEVMLVGHANKIEMIYEQMKDPESPLYQAGATDKDLVRIASIYVDIDREGNSMISEPADRRPRGGIGGDVPVDEYVPRDRTESERLQAIEDAVKDYNSKPKISISSILGGVKKYNITKETALTVSKILREMESDSRSEHKPKKEEMEI